MVYAISCLKYVHLFETSETAGMFAFALVMLLFGRLFASLLRVTCFDILSPYYAWGVEDSLVMAVFCLGVLRTHG
ncbi:hypothetical protein L1987_02424 [Smallanthus sonchifolius]|uniref:Uncharacterized protein n=1 Tax=Smallanthus sonchifolius TaxID=185202 RepID=A0ACB9K7X1_9ASTR|nr:hypothetical protein L1987_02424 [Smallanthus sonchifolius]